MFTLSFNGTHMHTHEAISQLIGHKLYSLPSRAGHTQIMRCFTPQTHAHWNIVSSIIKDVAHTRDILFHDEQETESSRDGEDVDAHDIQFPAWPFFIEAFEFR